MISFCLMSLLYSVLTYSDSHLLLSALIYSHSTLTPDLGHINYFWQIGILDSLYAAILSTFLVYLSISLLFFAISLLFLFYLICYLLGFSFIFASFHLENLVLCYLLHLFLKFPDYCFQIVVSIYNLIVYTSLKFCLYSFESLSSFRYFSHVIFSLILVFLADICWSFSSSRRCW
jgi:hypothetical protein